MYKYTKIQGLDSREITSLPETKTVIYMARQFNHRPKQVACSSQYPFVYNESLQHPTIAVLLVKILIFFNHSVVFTCSKVIRGPTRFGKALNLIFPKLSSQNMRGFDQVTILSPSFHGLSKKA